MSVKAKGLITIVNGPSKFDLMTALFVTKPNPIKVTFATKNHGDIYCSIIGIKKEDGSGESWIIEATANHINGVPDVRLSGYFSTVRRTGHFTRVN